MRHPVFVKGRYDTGFIDEHMDGGKGGDSGVEDGASRRVAYMVAAIAAYERDKDRASHVSAPSSARGADRWKTHGRRAALRGGLR